MRDAEVSGASLLALGGLAGAGATALSQLLRCLDGTALASLALLQQKLLTDDCSALARLTSLRRLHVVFEGPVRQPLPALPLLEQLAVQAPALRSLDQLGWQLAAQPSAGAVLPPQQLTSLTLRSSCDALPPLQPLTALTQLHELEVVEEAADWEQEGLPLLATTAFPSLQRVAFTSHRGLRVSAAGHALGLC